MPSKGSLSFAAKLPLQMLLSWHGPGHSPAATALRHKTPQGEHNQRLRFHEMIELDGKRTFQSSAFSSFFWSRWGPAEREGMDQWRLTQESWGSTETRSALCSKNPLQANDAKSYFLAFFLCKVQQTRESVVLKQLDSFVLFRSTFGDLAFSKICSLGAGYWFRVTGPW